MNLLPESYLEVLRNKALKKVINKIKLFTIMEEHVRDGFECSICLEKFEINDQCREIKCKHRFHKDCVDDWLSINCTCPICRYNINDNIEPNFAQLSENV